jgi:hypothetical protein
VTCKTCFAETQEGTVEQATHAWNTRTESAEIKKLRAVAEGLRRLYATRERCQNRHDSAVWVAEHELKKTLAALDNTNPAREGQKGEFNE